MLSVACVVLAALFWGVSGGIGAILMDEGWGPYVVSLYRGAVGLMFMLFWLAIRAQDNGLGNPKLWFWSVVAGLGVTGNFAFYFTSISEGSVAVAATLMYCAPVFVYLLSFALRLEQPTWTKWGGIVVVMLGVMLLTQIYSAGATSFTMMGTTAGLLSGLSYAVFIFGFKYALPHGSPQAILSIAFTVLVLALLWPADTNRIVAALGASHWLWFAALGVLGGGVSFILYIEGLINTAPSIAAVVAMVEPVTAALFGVTVLHEQLAGFQVLGIVLILLAVTGLSVHSRVRRASLDL
ncbi:DMT family transporter [Marinobacterium sp. AK62]|uniref:DMT family transporter n=1 Tax=Marinobacterium alkalitolerans TaxID=1542925 RepID=A0ABS3ZFV5_9GAMM|nr:DMT family transporter [Marinobacterium alkalitolerans]MBP0050173.1 DMT family transporter [Marinobacterium alkalitolerans]